MLPACARHQFRLQSAQLGWILALGYWLAFSCLRQKDTPPAIHLDLPLRGMKKCRNNATEGITPTNASQACAKVAKVCTAFGCR